MILNAEDSGDSLVIITEDNDVLIKREDIENTRLRKGLGRVVVVEGETYVSLKSIEGVLFKVNEKKAELEISALPALFGGQTIDAAFTKPYDVTYSKDNSAFLNYGFLYDSQTPSLNLSTELGIRRGDYLGLATFNYFKTEDENKWVRLLTSVRSDDRTTLGTFIAGDSAGRGGPLGAGVILGGVNFTKNYSINPYFLQYPSLSLKGAAETPSELNVYVNDMLVRSQSLAPGEFTLNDVPATVGLGTARLVIKDAYGKETTVSESFFYSDRLIKAGLHEYSYSLGWIREELGEKNFSYGVPAAFIFHNYGFSDRVKAGYSFEATDRLVNAGSALTVKVANVGVVEGALAMSSFEGTTGAAGFIGHSFRSRVINTQLSITARTEKYSTITLAPSADKPSLEFSAGVGWSGRELGSMSVGYAVSRMHIGPDSTRYTVSYNKGFKTWFTFFASANRVRTDGSDTVDEFFIGFHRSLGKDVSGSVSYTDRDGSVVKRAAVQKNLLPGAGLGWRASADNSEGHTDASADVQYQTSYAVYGAGYRDISNESSYSLSMAGGIGYIDGSLFMSRPIYDSFAKVKVGDLEDVRVYYYSNDTGRTDKNGEAIVPVLRGLYDNKIEVGKYDIPIDYRVQSLGVYVNPQYRSGVCVDIDAERFLAYTGRLFIKAKGADIPVEFYEMIITTDVREIKMETGRGGEFYFEDPEPGQKPLKDRGREKSTCDMLKDKEKAGRRIKPGTYNGFVKYEGKTCGFIVAVPPIPETPSGDTGDPFVDLGDIVCGMEGLSEPVSPAVPS